MAAIRSTSSFDTGSRPMARMRSAISEREGPLATVGGAEAAALGSLFGCLPFAPSSSGLMGSTISGCKIGSEPFTMNDVTVVMAGRNASVSRSSMTQSSQPDPIAMPASR